MEKREEFIYKKQFIMAPFELEGLYSWKRYPVGEGRWTLHVHPRLESTLIEDGNRHFLLLGYMLDWRNPEFGNERILRRLFENESFEEVLKESFEYGGRFAAVYWDESICRVFHDAGGQREVYYHLGGEGVSCASQLPIMSEFLVLEQTDDKEVMELYASEDFEKSKKQWVGQKTIFKGVRGLRPNFYLDMNTGNTVRYWPAAPLERKSLEWASENGARMLRGFIKAASVRKRLVVPVTAGWDSRVLLAASKDVSEDARYFVIRFPWMDNSHQDIAVSKKMMSDIGVDFEIIDPGQDVDEVFREAFLANTAYARESNLVGVYNVLYKRFSDCMSISSHVSEVVRSYEGSIRKADGRFFSTLIGYDGSNEYVSKMCQEWLDENLKLAYEMKVDPAALFYWEEGLSWEASHRSETDIAIEEYCPFSCRNLLESLISVDPTYRNKYNCPLYKRIMQKLWPQVLSQPVNPSDRNTLKGVLVSMDWMYPLKKIKKKF